MYLADEQVGGSSHGITALEPPRRGRGFPLPSPALGGLCPLVPVGSVWHGVLQNAHRGCLSPRGWCTTSSTEARRPRSSSVRGPMAPSRWYVPRATSPRATCPPRRGTGPARPRPRCAPAGLRRGFLLLGRRRAAPGHPRHPAPGRLHLHGAGLGGTAHPGDPLGGDGTPVGPVLAAGLYAGRPFCPQLSLFFDIVLSMARGVTEEDFVKGGSDVSARSARSVLWASLRTFPLSMGERRCGGTCDVTWSPDWGEIWGQGLAPALSPGRRGAGRAAGEAGSASRPRVCAQPAASSPGSPQPASPTRPMTT